MTPRKALTTKQRLEVVIRYCRCPMCSGKFGALSDVEFDHIHGLQHGGDNSLDNFRPLCAECHKVKTKQDAKDAAKGRRIRGENARHRRAKIPSRPMPGTKASGIRKSFSGEVEGR